MADGHDRQNGRMLLTDFDAPLAGRPVPGAGQSAFPLPVTPLPTLSALASSLELDFEDDEDDGRDQPAFSGGNERHTRDKAPKPPPGNPERSAADGGDGAAAGAYADASAPTWEEFTQSFRRNPPPGASATARARKSESGAFSGGQEADDDELDVLSMLASMAEEENAARAVPPPSRASGRPERIEDWYQPPENQPDPVMRVENWYEEPEDKNSPDAAAPEREDRRTTFRVEAPAGEGTEEGGAARPARPARDTMAELFTNVDIEQMWEEKLRRQRHAAPEEDGALEADFSAGPDVEIPGEQQGPQSASDAPAPAEDPSVPPPKEDHDGDETVIMSADNLRKAEIAALYADFHRARLRHSTTVRADEGAPGGGGAAAPFGRREIGAPAGNAPDDSLSFIADFDATRNDTHETTQVAAPLVKNGDMGDAAVEVREKSVIGASGNAARGAAADNPEPTRRGEPDARQTAPSPETGTAASDDAVHEGRERNLPERGRDNPVEISEEPDYLPDVHGDGAAQPSGRGLTTDDVLDDVDFDLYGVDPSVSKPVIDDSAINKVPASRRAGTGAAVAVDSGEPSGEGESSVREEEAADSVAVDPFDVFSNLDQADFSHDVDDDMRELMEANQEEIPEAAAPTGVGAGAGVEAGAGAEAPAVRAAPAVSAAGKKPRSVLEKAARRVAAGVGKYLPSAWLQRLEQMVAWRENWWFYCDLAAAIIASASLAIILSYWFWYR